MQNAKKLRNHITSLTRSAKKDYGREKFSDSLRHTNPRKWHRAVKQITGKSIHNSIKISHPDGTYTTVDEVNQYFTHIWTSFPSPTQAQKSEILDSCADEGEVVIDEMTTYKTLMKVKANCSAYPDELPPKLIREYAPFIAKPLSVLINLCFRIGIFPAVWNKAYVRIIPKVTNPKSCDELRPISQTPCLAKVAETFIMRVLLDQIQGSIDQRQYSGLKDCNTSVYLVRMHDSLLKWVEKGHSFVDLGAIDFRKAFDLINHIVAALNLKLMGAKKKTLTLVLDFFRQRMHRVFALYECDTNSKWSSSTCGAPQGTKLAAIVFLPVINFLIADYDDRYKFVDDLSFTLKYLVQNGVVTPQFSSNFFNVFTKECVELNLEIIFFHTRFNCFGKLILIFGVLWILTPQYWGCLFLIKID